MDESKESPPRSIHSYYDGVVWYPGWEFPASVRELKERRDVEALLPLLENLDRRVASAAAETLADLGERRAVEPLYRRLRAMGRGPFDEREWSEWLTLGVALAWLEGAGSPWANELLVMLDEDNAVGWYAGHLLANMGDRRAIDPIVASLSAADASDEAQSWKWEKLTKALGELRAVEAVDVLSAALPGAHWTAKEDIAWALHDIGDARAVPALISAVDTRHGVHGPAENAIWVALEEFATPEAKQAVETYKRSLGKRRRFWFF
jgi:HEAT repeat protein